MSRLPIIQTEVADREARDLLEAVRAKLKITPNMTRVMANSPAVLEGYLAFSGALARGSLAPKLREQIALAVGEQNGCQYCVSAHTAIGKLTGLAEEEIEEAREGRAHSAKDQAALEFTRVLIAHHGRVPEADFERIRQAGFGAGEIAEIIAHTALNIFTNYFNMATDVDVDFPKVAMRKAA